MVVKRNTILLQVKSLTCAHMFKHYTTVPRKNCNYMSLCSKDIDYQKVSTFFWTHLYLANCVIFVWDMCKNAICHCSLLPDVNWNSDVLYSSKTLHFFSYFTLCLQLYLCHVCYHFEKHGFLNVLYQLQVHMHDYVRAAMTCIRFYQKGARNYGDLASNLEHLYRAQSHLENELLTAQSQTGARSSPGIVCYNPSITFSKVFFHTLLKCNSKFKIWDFTLGGHAVP
jgi:hypothetical protein